MSEGYKINAYVTIVTEECCNCGIIFGLTEDFQRRRIADKKSFYCPSGHTQHYLGKTAKQKHKDEMEKVNAQLLAERRRREESVACCDRERRRRHGMKGALRTIQKRYQKIKAGAADAD